MKVSIFTSIDGFPSLDRYAQELSQHFPSDVEVDRVWFQKSPGWKGRVFDKHLRYLQVAKQRQGDYNIITSEGYSFLLLALPAERTITICHDVHPLIYQGPSPPGLWRWRYRLSLRMMRRARFVVTVSQHTRKDLLKYCPFLSPERVVPVHSGLASHWTEIQNPACLAAFRKEHGLEDKRAVLHVGNDNWYKNFAALLRAFAGLEDKDLILIKVGEIARENRELVSRLGLKNRLLHIPRVDNQGLLLFYNVAEMLVFPSWHEGFGWPPLEAMACGCPVIASSRASLPEVCGDACLYIQPEDVAGIGAAMEKLLEDGALRVGLSAKGKVQAARFRWETTAKTLLTLFQDVRP